NIVILILVSIKIGYDCFSKGFSFPLLINHIVILAIYIPPSILILTRPKRLNYIYSFVVFSLSLIIIILTSLFNINRQPVPQMALQVLIPTTLIIVYLFKLKKMRAILFKFTVALFFSYKRFQPKNPGF